MAWNSFFLPEDQTTLILFSWILTYLLHSTLLLGTAYCITTWGRLRSNHTIDTIWKGAMIGGLLTASLQVALGVTPMSGTLLVASIPGTPAPEAGRSVSPQPILEERPALASDHVPAVLKVETGGLRHQKPIVEEKAELAGSSKKTERTRRLTELRNDVRGHIPVPVAPALDPKTVQPDGNVPALLSSEILPVNEGHGINWPQIGLVVWMLLGVGFILRIFLMRLRLTRALRPRAMIRRGVLPRILARLCQGAGLNRRIRLTRSGRLSGPVAIGSSEICVPNRAVKKLGPELQETMLAHELAHLVRRDPTWLVGARLMEGVFFFQPLNRIARRRLQDVAEFLCDDWAVQRTQRGLSLAKCLAEVAEWRERAPSPELATGMAENRSSLVRRVERLLDESRDVSKDTPSKWRFSIMSILLLIVAFLAPAVSAIVDPPPEMIETTETISATELAEPLALKLVSTRGSVGAPLMGYLPISTPPAPKLGIEVGEVSDALAAHLGVKADEVMMIANVVRGSLAEGAELHRHDIITAINGKTPASSKRLRDALAEVGDGNEMLLRLVRKGSVIEVVITSDPGNESRVESGGGNSEVENRLRDLRNKKKQDGKVRSDARKKQSNDRKREMKASKERRESEVKRQKKNQAAAVKREKKRHESALKREKAQKVRELKRAEILRERELKQKKGREDREQKSRKDRSDKQRKKEREDRESKKKRVRVRSDDSPRDDRERSRREAQRGHQLAEEARSYAVKAREEAYRAGQAASQQLAQQRDRLRSQAESAYNQAQQSYTRAQSEIQRRYELGRRLAHEGQNGARQHAEVATNQLRHQMEQNRARAREAGTRAHAMRDQAGQHLEQQLRHLRQQLARSVQRIRELEQAARSAGQGSTDDGDDDDCDDDGDCDDESDEECELAEELEEEIEELAEEIEELEEEFIEEFEESMELVEEELSAESEEMEEIVEELMESFEESMEGEMMEVQEVLEQLEEQLEEEMEIIEGSIEETVEPLEDEIEEILESIEPELEEIEEIVEESIEPIIEEVEEVLEALMEAQDDEDRSGFSEEEASIRLEQLQRELESRLSRIDAEVRDRVEDVEPMLHEIQSRIEESIRPMQEELSSRFADVQPIMAELESRLHQMTESEEFTEQLRSIEPALQELAQRFHSEIEPRLHQFEGQVQSELQPRLAELERRIEEVVNERMHDLQKQIEELEAQKMIKNERKKKSRKESIDV